MTRWGWAAAVAAALGAAGATPGQAPGPAAPAAAPREGDVVVLRTAGQPVRRLSVVRVSRYPDGEILADMKDEATGERFTLPVRGGAGPRPVAAAPPPGPAPAVPTTLPPARPVAVPAAPPARAAATPARAATTPAWPPPTLTTPPAGLPSARADGLPPRSAQAGPPARPAATSYAPAPAVRTSLSPGALAAQSAGAEAPPAARPGMWPRWFNRGMPTPTAPPAERAVLTPPSALQAKYAAAFPPPAPARPPAAPIAAPVSPPSVTAGYAVATVPAPPATPAVVPAAAVAPVSVGVTPFLPPVAVAPRPAPAPPAAPVVGTREVTWAPAPAPLTLATLFTPPRVATPRVRPEVQMAAEVRPWVTDLMTAARPSLRERAASALADGRYGSRPEVKATLAKAARTDPAPGVRAHCVRLLSGLGYCEAGHLRYLAECERAESPELRAAAAAALDRVAPGK